MENIEVVFTFYNTHGAIAGEQALLAGGFEVRVMSLPSSLGAGCGICLRVDHICGAAAQRRLAAAGIEVQGSYLAEKKQGKTLYTPLEETHQGALAPLFAVAPCEVMAFVGSGGKTTLMWALAAAHRNERVLVTTTTKILYPDEASFQRIVKPEVLVAEKAPPTGITLCGVPLPGTKKLAAPPLDALRPAAAGYDLVLVEGDGAARRPLKGWAGHEPVVPGFATATVGVIPAWPLGQRVDASRVHRLPLFTAISGAAEGETLLPSHLAAAISHRNGLFAGAVGRRVLFFSQWEKGSGRRGVEEVLMQLPPHFLSTLERVVAGSAKENRGELLWRA